MIVICIVPVWVKIFCDGRKPGNYAAILGLLNPAQHTLRSSKKHGPVFVMIVINHDIVPVWVKVLCDGRKPGNDAAILRLLRPA